MPEQKKARENSNIDNLIEQAVFGADAATKDKAAPTDT